MYQSIVGTRPDNPCFDRRFHHCKDGAIVFDAGVVLRYRAAGRTLFGFVVAGQIRANHRPALALIGGLEDQIAAGVERFGVMRRKDDGEIPLKAVFHRRRAIAHRIIGPNIDHAALPCVAIIACYQTAVRAGKDDV